MYSLAAFLFVYYNRGECKNISELPCDNIHKDELVLSITESHAKSQNHNVWQSRFLLDKNK